MQSVFLDGLGAVIRFHDIPGPGRPLIFLHGLGCASSSDYPRVISDTALSRRRFVLVDLPGFGFSDRPTGYSYSVEALAGAVVELLSRLKAPAFDLFGHSMGGTVAIVAAAFLPGRISRLVVAEPNLDPGGGMFSRGIAAQSESDYRDHGHAEVIRGAVQDGKYNWAGTMAVSSAVAVHRSASSLVRGGAVSWRAQLLALPMPRTVIFGERSLPNPDTLSLPRAGISVAIVAAAGHMLMWDNPSGLALEINRALLRPR
jgi:pimeloyl-ACP methyl ester carboxylesterase